MSFHRTLSKAALAGVVFAWLLAGCAAPAAPAQNSLQPETTPSLETAAPALPVETEAAEVTAAVTAAVTAESTAAPSETDSAAEGFTVTDALGREVHFDQPPQRVALVGRAVIMLADAAYMFPDASERIVALSKTNQGLGDFIDAIDPTKQDKAALEVEVGAEQVAAVQPDAVILKSMMAEKLGAPLEALGLKVVYLDFETPEQYPRDLAVLGQIFNDEARAQEVTAFYQERVDRVTQAVADVKEEEKPRVLLLYYNEKDGQAAFNVPPMSWIQTQMVEMAGGKPVWEDAQLGEGWTKVNLEQVAAWDADQIYLIAYAKDSSELLAQVQADAQWQAMRAVQEGKIYAFPGDFYSWDQADARWILGLQWLAVHIQPEKFAGLDMQQELVTFYQQLYRQDASFVEQTITPLLEGELP